MRAFGPKWTPLTSALVKVIDVVGLSNLKLGGKKEQKYFICLLLLQELEFVTVKNNGLKSASV